MNKTDVKLIIKIAFKICFLYLLRTFMPSFGLRKYIDGSSCRDYNKEILSEIAKLKKVIQQCETNENNKSDSDSSSSSSSSSSSDSDKDDNCPKIEKKKMKHEAIKTIKKEITTKLKEKYGDDTQVEFSERSDLSDGNSCKSDCDDGDKSIYSLKIKLMGNCDPDAKKFKESEIYVNTKHKTFMVRTKKGFETFPLIKRSVVKCEKV